MDIFVLELYFKIHRMFLRDTMIIKKFLFGAFCLIFLNGCAQNTALLGPVYTFGSSGGSISHAGLSYGSEKMIIKMTGKSTGENIKEFYNQKKKEKEFTYLVKQRFKETRKKIGKIQVSQ